MAGEDGGLRAGEADVPIYVTLRLERLQRFSPTSPPKPSNQDVKRCTNVRGIFLRSDTALRLVGLLPVDVDDK
jgi:hypothetical protein